MDVNGYAAAIVLDPDLAPLLNRHINAAAPARHGFINAVIDDLKDEVMKPNVVSAADVHSGAAADCL